MAEAKKTRAKSTPKSVQKADLVEMAAIPAAETVETVLEAEPVAVPEAPAKSEEATVLFASVRVQGDALRQAMSEAMTTSAKGVLEVNGKIIDALNTQRDAAIDLWRTAISPSPLPEAFKEQSHLTRQAYEAASAQWKDVAETTALWFTKSLEPLRSAFQYQRR